MTEANSTVNNPETDPNPGSGTVPETTQETVKEASATAPTGSETANQTPKSTSDFQGSGVSGAEATITALQAEIAELRQRAEEAERRLLYANAEFQNISRRKEEQYQANLKHASSEFIRNLLPVVDNFERALKAAEQSRNYEALVGGVNGTLKQLLTALQKAGVTPILAEGQEFDPNFHEAIGHAEDSLYPANTVAEEVQRGYLIHDRVLRPTLVKVSMG